MNTDLSNTEIQEINIESDNFTISTNTDSKKIKFNNLLGYELKDLSDDDSSGTVGAVLGTLVGLAMGEFTAILGGGVSGWLISKFFKKEKIVFISFNLNDKTVYTFTSKEKEVNDWIERIENAYNDYLSKKIKINISNLDSWKNNLTVKQKLKSYIAFKEIFSNIDFNIHDLIEEKITEQYLSPTKENLLSYNNLMSMRSYSNKFLDLDIKRKKINTKIITERMQDKNLKGLISSQKKAVLTDDDSTLINAGAGSGKTKTILHKIAYLLDNKISSPEEILVLAYNKNVKEELINRLKSFYNKNIKEDLYKVANENVFTFHGFGAKQLKNQRGAKFIEKASDFEHELRIKKGKEIDQIINDLYKNKKFKENLIKYFSEYFFTYRDYFEDIESFEDYVKYIRNIGQITLSGIPMRSYEEVEIANFLFLNGIKFEYEKEYSGKYLYESEDADFSVKDKNHLKKKADQKYRPDFYLSDYDIYLEHFALNKNNEAPPFFKNPAGYSEQYFEKVEVHNRNKTKLICTYSWEKSEAILLKELEKKLKKFKVKFKKLPEKEILKEFKKSGKLNNFSDLISTFMSHYKSNELDISEVTRRISVNIYGDNNQRRCLVFLDLFKQIFKEYQDNLAKENAIDFDDMIINGRKNVTDNGYKHIIVDEFQDISQARAKLLRKIQNENNSKLFCVGDDWQAINKFNGGDISIFTLDFKRIFGYFERVDIDTTFRYSDNINNISSNFIQKNPSQLKKTVKAVNKYKDIIRIYDGNNFHEVIKKVSKNNKNKVFIIGRYNSDKYDSNLKKRYFNSNIISNYEINQLARKNSQIEYKTIHSSKGLEADVVLLINMFPGVLGFPSQMQNDEIISIVLPNPEKFLDAEERRLMYVAMTRAKKEVHIFTGKGFFGSDFTKELQKDFPILISENKNRKTNKQKRLCPIHKIELIKKNGYKGPFYGCPKWKPGRKGCNYTEDA